MSVKAAYYCGTPESSCTGSFTATSKRDRNKIHSSPEQAFDCAKRYLVRDLGYERLGGREFGAPNNGPIHVLTKKIRFGSRYRAGKEGRIMRVQHEPVSV